MKKVRLQDIADRMGISVVTVSNAVSGRSGVSSQLRADIVKMAEELGYQTQKRKKTEQSSRGKQIGVIVPAKFLEIEGSFYWDLYQELVCEIAKCQNYAVLEMISNEMLEKKEVPGLITDGQADGIIVMGDLGLENALQIEQQCKKPIVFIDYFDEALKSDCVQFNNYMGMYEVVKYVLEMGHTKIAYVGNIYATDSIFDRYMGTLRATVSRRVPMKKEWLISDRDGKTGQMHIELPEELPTAFVCNSDFTAGILKEELLRKGIKVPEDVSVTGFDNYQSGDSFLKELTTYDVNKKQMAIEAVQMMQTRMDQNTEEQKQNRKTIHVDGKLLIRDSVKRI